MTKTRRELIQNVIEAMGFLRASLYHGHGPMFIKHGIGRPHFIMMMKMASSDEGVSVTELAEAMDVTPGAITQLIDRLVDKGLVERFEDPKDRRVVRIRLSGKAKTRWQKMRDFHFEKMTAIFKNLSDEELAQLANLIKKIEPGPRDTRRQNSWQRWQRVKEG